MPKHPKVFLDITIGPKASGRIVIELFTDLTPFNAENFRGLCTGDYGTSPSGHRLFYLDSLFHKISPKEYCVGGDFVHGTGRGGESIYGGPFPDEDFTRRHCQAGVVSGYKQGANSTTSQFLITFGPVPSLDDRFVVFGQVVQGMSVVRDIQKVPIDANYRPLVPIRIFNCGEIDDGREHIKFEEFKEQLNIYRAYAEKRAQRKDEHLRKYKEMMERRAKGEPSEPQIPLNEDSDEQEEIPEEPVEEEIQEVATAPSVSQDLKERMAAVKARLKQMKRLNEEAVLAPTLPTKNIKKQEWEEEEKLVNDHLDEVGIGADKRYLLDNMSKVRGAEVKKRKKTQNTSFGWEQFNEDAVLKSYHRRLRKLKFDPTLYAASQASPNHSPPPERVDSLASELESEQRHRKKFSRHRAFFEDMDINFVNERNRVYNKKLDRHFSQYVSDIKSSLERGSAL